MTTTTEHVQAILETLDTQLINPLARDVTITMSRDEAAALITATSEETTLTVWSAASATTAVPCCRTTGPRCSRPPCGSWTPAPPAIQRRVGSARSATNGRSKR